MIFLDYILNFCHKDIRKAMMVMYLVERPLYLDSLRAQLRTPDVKVLVGVRRAGKSCVLTMFADELARGGIPRANLFYKRLDAFDVPLDYDANQLYLDLSHAIAHADPNAWFYVFLDEVQAIDGWEKVVRRLHTRERTDVYITGSNAKVLSGELATFLTGRYWELTVYPLSFEEYCVFSAEYRDSLAPNDADAPSPRAGSPMLKPTLANYLRFGGMPGLFSLNRIDEQSCGQELQAIFESILFRDVASRLQLRNLPALERVGRFLLATCGNLFSLNNVVNTLKSAGTPLDPKTVESFIAGMRESFLVREVPQYGLQGKRLLRPLRKFYPVDLGFKSLASGFGTIDMGARLETAVCLELLRRGYDVSVGTLPTGEIDFVARRSTERMYLQVTQSLLEEGTRERELAPLRKLTDAYPRLVLTADRLTMGVTEEGIRIMNVEDWLLGEVFSQNV